MFIKLKHSRSLLFHDHKFHVTLKIYKLFSKQNYIKCKVTLKLQEFVAMSSCGEVWLMEVTNFQLQAVVVVREVYQLGLHVQHEH